MSTEIFKGFTRAGCEFLAKLVFNNNREWFGDNKEIYEGELLEPAKYFIAEFGKKMQKHLPNLVADPRINKSLFRLNRDVRFSKDKQPYKTHLGILFWEGPGKRMENPGYYLQLNADQFMFASGQYGFSKDALSKYRDAVIHPKMGKELEKILAVMIKSDTFKLGGEKYKRVPRGFDKDHERVELLKFKGLFASVTMPPPDELFSAKLVDYCVELAMETLDLHKWLVSATMT